MASDKKVVSTSVDAGGAVRGNGVIYILVFGIILALAAMFFLYEVSPLIDRAQHFADSWVPAHISSGTQQLDDSELITKKFVSDANAIGLSEADLVESLGDLEIFLSACIESAGVNSPIKK